MVKWLVSSPLIGLLQERGEGQWLIPHLSVDARWEPNLPVDYSEVKKVWFKVMSANPEYELFVEKSPPNMVRFPKLRECFQNSISIVNNRNPYANCASILYSMHKKTLDEVKQRQRILHKLAEQWVLRSQLLLQLKDTFKLPQCTYEEFCANPKSLLPLLSLSKTQRESVQVDTLVQVKDYPLQGIVNQNERQIGLLNEQDVKIINEVLQSELSLLDAFGYKIIS
jgi:hypothetical protein